MALTTTITAKSVTQSQKGLFTIVFNMQYKNGEVVLIDKDYGVNYSFGDPFSRVFFNVKELMQDDIAKYKAEQLIFLSNDLSTIVTNLNNTVGV